jgi:hypothetical protein
MILPLATLPSTSFPRALDLAGVSTEVEYLELSPSASMIRFVDPS